MDKWIGKKIIVPLVIRVCQFLNITNHYFANTVTFVAWMCMFYGSWVMVSETSSLFIKIAGVCTVVVISLLTVYHMLVAAMNPEK